MQRFQNKVVLVTGAAAGIGEATARRFADEGANAVLADWNLEKAQAVASELPVDKVLAVKVDVSSMASVQQMIDATIERFGRLDVLVNNAGVHIPGTTLETTEADWRNIAPVNIDGAIFCSKLALPHLIQSKGSIVSTASVSAGWAATGRGVLLREQGRGSQLHPGPGAGSRRPGCACQRGMPKPDVYGDDLGLGAVYS